MATPFTSKINGCAKIQVGASDLANVVITSSTGENLEYKDVNGVTKTCMAVGGQLTTLSCKGTTTTTNLVTIGNSNANSNGADILFALRGNVSHPDSNGGMKFIIDPSVSDVYHFIFYAYDGSITSTVADFTNVSQNEGTPILFSGKLCDGPLTEEKFAVYVDKQLAIRAARKEDHKMEIDEDLSESQIDAIKRIKIREEKKSKK
jgi:hypothetical protein